MSDIKWSSEKRKLKDLVPWERNPRQINKDQAERLSESFDTFGQVETIAIGPNGEVYNGHQRLNVLKEKHGKDYQVEVRVSSRQLLEKEREKLTVFLHKGATGEFDFDMLANEFELDELLDWGFSERELQLDSIFDDEDLIDSFQRAVGELSESSDVTLVMKKQEAEFLRLMIRTEGMPSCVERIMDAFGFIQENSDREL